MMKKNYIELSPDRSKIEKVSFEDRFERAYIKKFKGGVSQQPNV